MKKNIHILIMILAVFTLLFVGCKKGGASKEITLKMYHYRDVTAPDAGHWFTEVEKFHETYPDIKLEVELGFNDPYHQKLQAMAVSGDIPDLVFLWPGKKTGVVTDRGLIKDLRPWLKGHEKEFKPIALTAQGPNGEIYELPESVESCHVMYTNEKHMKDLGLTFPKTLDELLAQGDKIRAAGLIPIAMSNRDGWEMQSCLLSTLTERAGGLDWWNKVVKGDGASFADQEFIDALNVIKILTDENMFSPGINQAEYEVSMNDFVAEKAVYYIDGGWKTEELTEALTPEQKKYVSFNAFPDIPNQKGQSGSTAAVAGTGFGMNAKLDGAKAEAAWKWIWYHSGPIGAAMRQKNGILTGYNLPPADDIDILMKGLIDFVSSAPMGPVIDNIMDGEGVEDILHVDIQKMMFGTITPEQAAQNYENWVAANDSNRK